MNEIYVVYWDLREASDAPWFGGVKIDGPDGICDIDWILSWSIIFVWVCLWLKVFSSYGVAFKAPSSKLVSLVTFLFRLFIIFWLLYSSFDLTLLFFFICLYLDLVMWNLGASWHLIEWPIFLPMFIWYTYV